MSANPTRVECGSPLDPNPGMQQGNLVLESIGRQEGLRALLAFSDLHAQIRQRNANATSGDSDLFQTERFVLDEVLQLICDRAHALAGCDGVLIALEEGADLVCRAAAGPPPIARGTRLSGESRFLRECLNSGKIVRCDDSATDQRLENDYCLQFGARSAVLIPLRGGGRPFGVVQAFSGEPWAFPDQDVRCFDLFAELVLSALKPEDQDRRFHWLSDVAGEILNTKEMLPEQSTTEAEELASEAVAVRVEAEAAPAPVEAQAAASVEFSEIQTPKIEPPVEPHIDEPLAQPLVIPVAALEPQEAAGSEDELDLAPDPEPALLVARVVPLYPVPKRFTDTIASRPGLSVVMGLVAVAALFSAGVWWGMQTHGKATPGQVASAPQFATAPPAPSADLPPPPVSDSLMSPDQATAAEASAMERGGKPAVMPKVTGVRHWSSSMGSTVVIDMDDEVPYEVHRLMSPERIYFDLHGTALASELDGKTMDVGDPSLSRVRVAQPAAGVTRIVLDTKDGSNFSVSMESNPYRLVVELRDNAKMNAASRPAGAPAKAASVAPLIAKSSAPVPARTGKFRIVLDAGHGGWDLGTVGRQGLLEKDLVLDVTRRLGRLLQTRLGSEVLFTRSSDDYLPLEQRADVANQAQADLFVSVHANYSTSANARGVETYYTNQFSAPGSHETGAREEDRHDNRPAPVSLSSGELRDKTEESRRLASSVQRALYATLATKSPDIRDRGIKDAAFAVLTGTTMPSILTEISFVSSPQDEHNLQSENYRQQIAEALYKGIARYQELSPRAKVAQLQPAVARR